jgi:hypothetical protein
LSERSSSTSLPRRALREPLLQFAVLGASLFLLHRAVAPVAADDTLIVVDGQKRRELDAQFEQAQSRKPTADESSELAREWADEEILFRSELEVVRDDPGVRQALVTQMRLRVDPGQAPRVPSDAELKAFYEAHRSKYVLPDTVRFTQYHVDAASEQAAQVQALLRALEAGERVAVSPMDYLPITEAELEAAHGAAYARKVMTLPLQRWSALRSERGVEIIRIEERTPSHLLPFEQARGQVMRDLFSAESARSLKRNMASLRGRFTVRIEE